MKKGKLIVIEGSDGAGKATQLNLLKEYLLKRKNKVQTIDFPRYYDSFYGKMVARFLRGEFGTIKQVDPHLASLLYALDRGDARDDINNWLLNGEFVLSNRYATSNLAHQSAKLTPKKRKKFIEWDMELEYVVNKLPKEDIVLYLYVPFKISRKLVLQKSKEVRAYAKGMKKDIHEKDLEYMKKSEASYLRLVKKFPHWVKINCIDKTGNLMTREEIHEEIKQVLRSKKII